MSNNFSTFVERQKFRFVRDHNSQATPGSEANWTVMSIANDDFYGSLYIWFGFFFARAFHRSISQSFHFHPKADSIETGLERKGFYFIFRYFYRRRNQKLFENEMVRLYRIKGFFFGEICLIFWSLEEEKVESRKITILCEIFIKVIFMKSQKFSRAAFKYFLIKFRSFPTCTFENFMQPGEDFKTHSRERMIYGQAHN